MATTNLKQWNPTAVNQENDAQYDADSQRAGGATNPSIFDARLANKAFFQWSTFLTALFQAFANKGFTTSDSNLNTLTATCAAFMTTADKVAVATTDGGPLVSATQVGPTYGSTPNSAAIEAVTQGAGGNYLYSGIDSVGVANFWVRADGLLSATTIQVGGISAANAIISGLLQAGSVAVSGALSAANAAISGLLQTGSLVVVGALQAASAVISGTLQAGSAVISGALQAASATVGGNVNVGSLQIGGGAPSGQVLTGNGSTYVPVAMTTRGPVNSNADGSYYQWADGLIEAWGLSANSSATGVNRTSMVVAFPVAFSAPPVVTCNPNNNPDGYGSAVFGCYPTNITNSGFTANLCAGVTIGGSGPANINNPIRIYFMAKGN
jgi:hypothetical protein